MSCYWKECEDYPHQFSEKRGNPTDNTFQYSVDSTVLFSTLREEIKEFESGGLSLWLPNAWNYDPFAENSTAKLGTNLVGTEIDVVLESPEHLYVGEAKEEMDLDGDGDLVLVHQLIRQYVMANILVRLCGSKKRVVPFLVKEKLKGREQVQVDFMVTKGWLKRENILHWDQIGSSFRGS